ncbi:MAG: NUDIX domain-containing protein [Pyrinomonadaceae bacterium]
MLFREVQPDISPLFASVGCFCIFNGKLLLLKRVKGKSYPGYWGVPSGKIAEGESPTKAVIRELFEETGILLSHDNLIEIKTFHVVNDDMNFLYTLFVTDLRLLPNIKLNDLEHVSYEWFTPEAALRLELVPDVDGCINEVFPHKQLELFEGYSPLVNLRIRPIEIELRNTLFGTGSFPEPTPNKIVSLGPPAVGKSTFLNALAKVDPLINVIRDTTWSRKGSNLNTFLKMAFEKGSKEYFFPFQLESLLRRYLYAISAPQNSAVDESIYTSLAYSRALLRLGWITKFEFQIFYSYYLLLERSMPKPTEIVFVTCDLHTMQKRIRDRRRRHEAFYSPDYIRALHFAFNEVAGDLERSGMSLTRLDSSVTSVDELIETYVAIKGNRN